MSENLPKKQDSEEIDLGQLFNAIGNLFERFYRFIKSIFKGVLSLIVYVIKAIVDNFKVISVVLLSSFALGVAIEKFREPVYYSEMLVRPYFESKYQLVSNIAYFNSLLENKNTEALVSIFQIKSEDVDAINEFEISIGPETENSLLQDYDKYIKSIDSIRAQEVSFDDFVENRDLYSSDIFSIRVESSKNDIFKSLSQGIKNTFSNEYSKKLMRVRDSTISIRKAAYIKDLNKIDTLQLMYLKILEKESEKGSYGIGVEGMFPLTQERTTTREFELFQNEIRLRDSIRVLDQKKIEENVYFDVLTDFSEIGQKSNNIEKKYSLIFPILALLLLSLMYVLTKIVKFTKEYEA
ncbi:hypothetical protein [Psychroserpens luteus]|uniref:Chain length determinant protein n=1 Tax=Psychroserpens luteus TaxID=1434066 RepID=A0ABW5ZZ69_9FLAO|nr:hypothetical protein [Psychroserpens luteus]